MNTGVACTTVAIVQAEDGLRFVAAATLPHAVLDQLAAYVRSRCDEVLWRIDARQVIALLDSKELDAAIRLYFCRAGERWDRERLEILTMKDGECWVPGYERGANATR